jgi:hypothetical protein
MKLSLGGIAMKLVLTAALAATLLGTAADAASVLYSRDFLLGTDYMAAALATGGYTVTSTNGDLSSFALGDYDIIVYAAQGNEAPADDVAALDAHIAGGGRVIFTTWTVGNPSLGADWNGSSNFTSLTVGPQFSAGITNPLDVVNPGWATFSIGLSVTSGTEAGSFAFGNSAIVIGNGGRTIWNGFLTDTVASERLYLNQLGFLSGGGAIPEPASWAMLIAGFGLTGAAMRRRRLLATA